MGPKRPGPNDLGHQPFGAMVTQALEEKKKKHREQEAK